VRLKGFVYCPISEQKCHNNDLNQVGAMSFGKVLERSLASPLMGQQPQLITAAILLSFLSTDLQSRRRRKRVVARMFPFINKMNKIDNDVGLDLSWLPCYCGVRNFAPAQCQGNK